MQGLSIFAGHVGYVGVYHAYVGEEYEVRLATSEDLTSSWNYVRTLVSNARSPKILVCGKNNMHILLTYEQWMTAKSRAPSRIAFELFDNQDTLMAGTPMATYIAPLTAGFMSQLEGDPMIYGADWTSAYGAEVLSASVGFRYFDTFRKMHQIAHGQLQLTVKGTQVTSSSFSGHRAAAYQAFLEMRGADGSSGSGNCGELKGQRYCLQEAAQQREKLADVWETPAVYIYAFAGAEDTAPEGTGAGGLLTVNATKVATQNDPLAGLGNPSWSVVRCPSGLGSDDCVFVSYYDRTAGQDAPQIAFVKPVP
jgi:uncharacterized protein (DUF697 family)